MRMARRCTHSFGHLLRVAGVTSCDDFSSDQFCRSIVAVSRCKAVESDLPLLLTRRRSAAAQRMAR